MNIELDSIDLDNLVVIIKWLYYSEEHNSYVLPQSKISTKSHIVLLKLLSELERPEKLTLLDILRSLAKEYHEY